MHAQSNVQLTTQPAGSLVLEILPNGEPAWLRPDPERAALDAAIHDAGRIEQSAHRLLDRYAITDAGRDALARAEAMENLFGPWPTVAEVFAMLPALAVLS